MQDPWIGTLPASRGSAAIQMTTISGRHAARISITASVGCATAISRRMRTIAGASQLVQGTHTMLAHSSRADDSLSLRVIETNAPMISAVEAP